VKERVAPAGFREVVWARARIEEAGLWKRLHRFVGIDVSKYWVDVHIRPEGTRWRCNSDPEGLAELAARLHPLNPRLVVMEASGGYEGLVAARLTEAGLAAAVVNPRQIRRFGEALGQLAKTDAIDARVIAHFAEVVRPLPRLMPDAMMRQLQELLARRRRLVAMITAEMQRLAKADSKVMQRSQRAVLRTLRSEQGRIDSAIDKLIQQSPSWWSKLDLLTSVPGVGDLVARTLLAELRELGSVDRHQIAALAGVAPFSRDSGRKKGKRSIRAGRVQIRMPVYMASLAAIRHNPTLQAFYRHLRAAGKPARLALVAVMRKLLTILNAMLRDNQRWELASGAPGES
jgi:transposase